MVKIESSKISHNCIHRFNYGERLSIRVNLDLKPYYKVYKSLLFYEVLNRVEFSLCDQYSIICVSIIVFTIFKIQSYLYNKTNKKNIALKLIN